VGQAAASQDRVLVFPVVKRDSRRDRYLGSLAGVAPLKLTSGTGLIALESGCG